MSRKTTMSSGVPLPRFVSGWWSLAVGVVGRREGAEELRTRGSGEWTAHCVASPRNVHAPPARVAHSPLPRPSQAAKGAAGRGRASRGTWECVFRALTLFTERLLDLLRRRVPPQREDAVVVWPLRPGREGTDGRKGPHHGGAEQRRRARGGEQHSRQKVRASFIGKRMRKFPRIAPPLPSPCRSSPCRQSSTRARPAPGAPGARTDATAADCACSALFWPIDEREMRYTQLLRLGAGAAHGHGHGAKPFHGTYQTARGTGGEPRRRARTREGRD
jgi:hypothetical protein